MTLHFKDTGYRGSTRSLGGVDGAPGRGLDLEETTYTGTGAVLLHPNPLRKWALISNDGSGGIVAPAFLHWNDDAATGSQILAIGASLLINEQLPWTGALSYASTAQTTITVLEASVSP